MPVKNPRINVVLEKPLTIPSSNWQAEMVFPLAKGTRPGERGAGDRGGYSAFRVRREKRTDIHKNKGIEAS